MDFKGISVYSHHQRFGLGASRCFAVTQSSQRIALRDAVAAIHRVYESESAEPHFFLGETACE